MTKRFDLRMSPRDGERRMGVLLRRILLCAFVLLAGGVPAAGGGESCEAVEVEVAAFVARTATLAQPATLRRSSLLGIGAEDAKAKQLRPARSRVRAVAASRGPDSTRGDPRF